MSKFLDQSGLQILWNQIKAKFIDETELTSALSAYYDKDAINTLLSGYATDDELASAINNLANVYVKKKIEGTNGDALIFNEADGGGAKFEHKDGSESFVGVNDGGKDGLMAQIYADKLVDGKWQGAKLDVTNGGIYYTVGNKSFAQRAVADNELVTKKDIAGLVGGMHFIGTVVLDAGETIAQAIERCYTEQSKVYADRKAGDIAIIKTPGNDQEFICDSNKDWIELGDQGLYATKAELVAEEEAREDADTTLETAIDAEEARAIAAEAKKVDKEISSAEGKAIIFNEADGGGAKFEHTDGTWSYVGVNNGGEEGVAAQIYAIDATASGHNLGAKLDVTRDGIFYTTGAASGSRASSRDVTNNEIAVKRDIDDKVATETTRAQAAEAGKLDIMPGDEHTSGNAYNLPYFFYTVPGADKVEVHTKTVTLDGNKTYGDYSLDVNAATTTAAGLMAAADKSKLDGIDTMTQAEIENICI